MKKIDNDLMKYIADQFYLCTIIRLSKMTGLDSSSYAKDISRIIAKYKGITTPYNENMREFIEDCTDNYNKFKEIQNDNGSV